MAEHAPGRLPNGARQLAGFAPVLRANAFPAAPDQLTTFLRATEMIGPRRLHDVHVAARAAFAPEPERRDEFDALFNQYFAGQIALAVEGRAEDEPPRAFDGNDDAFEAPELGDENPSGEETSKSEVLTQRVFDGAREYDALRLFQRRAVRELPRRRSHRLRAARRGRQVDARRALREIVRTDDGAARLPKRARRTRQRNILLLVDVSGSMKAQTDGFMRFAHAVTRAADRVECFTFSTRLTRVTRALRLHNRDRALERASETVADWDGGTRIGDALEAFMAVPRFAGYARGAYVIVLSDGLERGDPSAMVSAMKKLSARAWRLVWLSPLAADDDYVPETRALAAIWPSIDVFDAASTPQELFANTLAHAARSRRVNRFNTRLP